MTDPIHEQLSAFHDGELSTAESELLLKRFQRDPQLRSTMGRYALIGEALRSKEAGGPTKDFAARVAKAIEGEEAPRLSWRPVAGWLKPVAGGAIAAGVAAVALVSLRVSPDLSRNETTQLSEAARPQVQQLVADEVRAAPEALPRYTVPIDNANRTAPPIQVFNGGRLANFVMAHSEYSSPLGQRNVLTGLLVDEPTPEPASESIDSHVLVETAVRSR